MAYDPSKLTALSALRQLATETKNVTDGLSTRIKTLEDVGAQANVLEGVKLNNTALAIANKMVNLVFATGETNGTFKVNDVSIAIAGLAALAYKSEVSIDELSTALKATINAKAESSDLTTLAGKVTTLIGNGTGDDAKSARTMAAEEVAKVVASAPEDFDTLKEISDWIENHSDDAAAMNSAITALQSKMVLGTYDDAGTQKEYATVKAYVEAVTANFISLTAISATTTGTGNAITAAGYDSATGAFTFQKGKTFVEAVPTAVQGNFVIFGQNGQVADSGLSVATTSEVTEMLNEVFGTT